MRILHVLFLLTLLPSAYGQVWDEIAFGPDYRPYSQYLEDQYFGAAVSVDGDYAVIGAFEAGGHGLAHVFHYSAGVWSHIADLSASDQSPFDDFGYSVGISGDVIVIGAPKADSSIGRVYLFEKPMSGWVDMTESSILTSSIPSTGDEYGWDVAISGDVVVVGARSDTALGVEAGAALIYEKPLTGWVSMTETAKLTADDGDEDHLFGCSVDIDGDVIVVGAEWWNYGGMDAGNHRGSAYVFTKPIGGWTSGTQDAQLSLTYSSLSDNFGTSVAISSGTIVVGASRYKIGFSVVGSAFVYEEPLGGWVDMSPTAWLTPSDGGPLDDFGGSVDVAGDTIVVGSRTADDNGSNSGSVYVFGRPSSGWVDIVEDAKLLASDGAINDQLGASVSITFDHLLSGALEDDDSASNTGSVYAYLKPVGGWVSGFEDQKLIKPPYLGNVGNETGRAVAMDGNIAVVGAYRANSEKGIAYVMEFDGTDWNTLGVLRASNPNEWSHFGWSVDIHNDQIVVGAVRDSVNAAATGAAYVFQKPSGGWTDMTQTAKLIASDGNHWDDFGYDVAIYNDEILIGASSAWVGGMSGEGRAYIFEKPAGGWTDTVETAKFSMYAPNGGGEFGFAVGLTSGVAVVGARRSNDNGNDAGAVYIFNRPSSGWVDTTQSARLLASDGTGGEFFGSSLDVTTDHIVVGAPRDSYGLNTSGAAYVFKKPATGWSDSFEDAKLVDSDAHSSKYFGESVSIDGDNIVVGAENDENGGAYGSGAVYVYSRTGPNWISNTETSKIKPSDLLWGEGFGSAVAISGDLLAVGARQEVGPYLYPGSCYLFGNSCPQTSAYLNVETCDTYTLPSGSATLSQSGLYLDTIVNSGGCDSTILIDLHVISFEYLLASGPGQVISQDTNSTYQWLNCDSGFAVIAGATSQSFSPPANGNFAVQLTNSICVDTSVCRSVMDVSLSEDLWEMADVHPNPAHEILNVSIPTWMGGSTYELYDLSGKLVFQGTLETEVNMIDISRMERGVYSLRIVPVLSNLAPIGRLVHIN